MKPIFPLININLWQWHVHNENINFEDDKIVKYKLMIKIADKIMYEIQNNIITNLTEGETK
jgi:hypothetical protein